MAGSDRELDLLRDRAEAQGRRIDSVERDQEQLREEHSKLDKAQAVVLVELGLLRDAVKSNRAWTGGAALTVVATAVGLILFGAGR